MKNEEGAMNEQLALLIERSGAMWAAARFDRSTVPVTVVFVAGDLPGGTVYDLYLERGAEHPHWSVRESGLTTEQMYDLQRARQRHRETLGVRLDVNQTQYVGFGAQAWIKNGRSDEWLPHVMKARIQVAWEAF